MGLSTKILNLTVQLLEFWANSDSLYINIVGPILVSSILVTLLFTMLQMSKKNKQRGVVVEIVGDEASFTIRNSMFKDLVEVPWERATTVADLFEQTCSKQMKNRFLGTRKLIAKEVIEEEASDGSRKMFEKLHLGDYQWKTYAQVFDQVCNFASGLVLIGHNLDTRLAIFSETRSEWFIALQGCLRQNITVVTVYASLGDDALIHSLNETEASTLICDSKQLQKVAAIRSKLETVTNVIYFAEEEDDDHNISQTINNMKVTSFDEVEKLGKNNPAHPRLPTKSDTAVIMYTGGTTGLPKGVVMTHGNIVATVAGVMKVLPPIGINDVYLAYLPLAHIFELEAEIVMSASGAAVGYGSTLTLSDTSNKIMKGTKGDASALQPTLMAAVPAILDRVRGGVLKKVEDKGGLIQKMFNTAYKRRLAAIEGSWFGAWGLEKLLWDVIVFRKIRSVLGGRIRFILSGAAPLSSDSQRFINICIGAPIGQAYGLTETCAGATFSEEDDVTVGRVGPPIPCSYVKLVSWDEGGYLISDKPLPRGEIAIGGFSVTDGYFKNEDKTKEVYKVDENGIRWFYTGDIGQFHSDGCLEIIDRKKDIVKLQHGEYISLGKVEAALVIDNYVESIMVYGDPFHDYSVALVVPSRLDLERWAQEFGIQYTSYPELCDKVEAINEVQVSLLKVAKDARLDKFEIPRKIMLLPESWTPESGLITASLKLKRELLKAKFNSELKMLYA